MHKSAAALEKCKDYGYMHMGEWDVLWSITAKAMLAAEIMRPGVLVLFPRTALALGSRCLRA